MKKALVVALLALWPAISWAEDVGPAAPAIAPENAASATSTHVPAEPAIVPVQKDAPAPFTGLLVPEGRYTELLEAELSVGEFRDKMEAYRIKDEAMEKFIEDRLQRLADPPFWEDPKVALTAGLVVGVVVTAVAIFGTWQLSEAVKK